VLAVTSMFVGTEEARTPDLLEQARSGDADAFCALCRSYELRLLRQALSVCGNASFAEELAQDTLVEAWKSLRRYNGRCQFFTWLCAILLNRYRNTLRERRPFPFSSLNHEDQAGATDLLTNLPDSDSPPDVAAEQLECNALLRRQIDRLPAKHREVIYLRFFVDHSLEGIAAALSCSVGTVKSRLFNALDKLRDMQKVSPEFFERNNGGESL